MKFFKVFLFSFISFDLSSQVIIDYPLIPKDKIVFDTKAPLNQNNSFNKSIVLWSDDFSNPSNWLNVNNLSVNSPHSTGDWTITSDLNAIPVNSLLPAAHSSASNGYAIINSEDAGPSAFQNTAIYHSDTLDFTSEPQVILKFEQSHRRFNEKTYVIFSTDAGNSWGEVEVNINMPQNTNSTNPELVEVNMTSYIGGNDSVQIGFSYVGHYDWFWAVDDVFLMTPENYDLSLDACHWSSTGALGIPLQYYKIPQTQITSIDMKGYISNLGAMPQSNVYFHANSGSYNGLSAPFPILPASTDTVSCMSGFIPASVLGTNVFNFYISSDSVDANPFNDSIISADSIEITTDIYARDKDILESAVYNQGNGFEVGNIFDIFNSQNLQIIETYIHSSSNIGSVIYAKVYSVDSLGAFNLIAQSDDYIINSFDLGSHVKLLIQGPPLFLNAGESYLIVVGSMGDSGNSNDLVIGNSGASLDQTSFFYNMTNQTWYYSNSTPMVRIDFTPTVSFDNDFELNGLSVYPNPTSSYLNIKQKLNVDDIKIVITDLNGKIIYQVKRCLFNTHEPIKIDVSSFVDATYRIHLTTKEHSFANFFVVKK